MTDLFGGGEPSEADVAWAAGLWEGEGSFYAATSRFRGTGRSYNYARASLTITDLDVVQRLRDIIGMGKIKTRQRKSAKGVDLKLQYVLEVSAQADVQRLANMLYPWFGERRRAQVRATLEHGGLALRHAS